MRKDLKEIISRLERQGWRLEKGRKGGKLMAFSPDRETVVPIHGTPSDHRALRNLIRS